MRGKGMDFLLHHLMVWNGKKGEGSELLKLEKEQEGKRKGLTRPWRGGKPGVGVENTLHLGADQRKGNS